MIEFQDPTVDRWSLVSRLKNQIQLLRALANFNIDGPNGIDTEELRNQRSQLIRLLKDLGAGFERLMELEAKSDKEPANDRNGEASKAAESVKEEHLISKFIRTAVPEEMAKRWDSKKFTGSLLVFFNLGQIESASLIEKKTSTEQDPLVNDFPADFLSKELSSEREIEVIAGEEDSFTILKSPEDSNIHFYFSLKESTPVELRIFNQEEEQVRQIDKFYDRPGDYIIVWDGLDDDGQEVPKEKYNCQLRVGEVQYERKSIDLS